MLHAATLGDIYSFVHNWLQSVAAISVGVRVCGNHIPAPHLCGSPDGALLKSRLYRTVLPLIGVRIGYAPPHLESPQFMHTWQPSW